MELGLSLGESRTTTFPFLDKALNSNDNAVKNIKKRKDDDKLGFCMALGRSSSPPSDPNQDDGDGDDEFDDREHRRRSTPSSRRRVDQALSSSSSDLAVDRHRNGRDNVPLQLDLLPSVPVRRGHVTNSAQIRFPWLAHNYGVGKGFDVNRKPARPVTAVTGEEVTEDGVTISSPNSTLSSFHMDFCPRNSTGLFRTNIINSSIIIPSNNNSNNIIELETERTSSRASDDEENGSTRKKLRLTKEQSAFLEESFKEHSTLNPKQKLALAKQLNLRPRQVEVWFQNRRARTKLKQTEVDCEYLKRCCETLTEENRRLQKELQELRALKTSQPFYMQLPATTLTMCPSCERVATAGSGTGNSPASKPGAHPFSQPQPGKS